MSLLKEVLDDLKVAMLAPSQREEATSPAPAKGDPIPAETPSQKPDAGQEREEEAPAGGTAGRSWRGYALGGLALVLVAVLAGALLLTRDGPPPTAPSPDVVAAYVRPQGSAESVQITRSDLSGYLANLPADERAAFPATVDGYRAALEQMAVDQLLWDWLLGRLGPESVQQMVFDVAAGRYPVSALDQVIAAIPVSESDIRGYFDAHADDFSGRALSEVRDEIAHLLRQQREAPYVAAYVAELASRASVIEHPEVLAVPEPDEAALRDYYEEHAEDLAPPRTATVDWLRFRRSEAARQAADAARADLQQGEDWAAVAQRYAEHATPIQDLVVVEGKRGTEFDRVVFDLSPQALSPVFDGGDAYYVVRMNEIDQEPAPAFNRVRDEIRAALWAEAAETWFQTRRESPAFVLDGHAYKAGAFYEAFKALPDDWRTEYNSTQGLQALAERTIEWLLVVQDARRQGSPPEGQGDVGTRVLLLTQATGSEDEIELDVSDEEILEYYNEHTEEFLMPTRFKIRYIAVETGAGGAETERAWTKAREAYERLRQLGAPPSEREFLEVAGIYVENPKAGNPGDWIIASSASEIEVIDTGEGLIAHPLYRALLDIKIDDLTEPFELDGTLYIVHVWDREEEQSLNLWQAENYLALEIGAEKGRAAARELSQKLLAQAGFTVYEGNLSASSGSR